MFDRVVLAPAYSLPPIPSSVTVIEHRAPTDASVALLKEMEDAARAKIERSFQLSDNLFECVIHQLRDCYNDLAVMRAAFSLNGKKITAEFSERSNIATPEVMVVGIRDAIATAIANHVVAAAMENQRFGDLLRASA